MLPAVSPWRWVPNSESVEASRAARAAATERVQRWAERRQSPGKERTLLQRLATWLGWAR